MMGKIAYYIFVIPFSHLPLPVLYLFTDFFYLLLITVVPYRREVIEGNLSRSFPDKSKQEIKTLKRQFYRHFTDILAEGIKNLTISKKQLKKRLKVLNPEIMDELYKKERNVLLVSGHFNNWEWFIVSQDFLFPHKGIGIGMPMTSKFWDKKINDKRERYGMQVVHGKNYKEKMAESPDKLKAVLVLSDQSPGNSLKSYWMNFLNQNTAILFGAEMMAHEMDYSTVGFITKKVKRGYYEVKLTLINEDPKEANWGEITEAHTKLLETAIIKNPAHWLWSHKKWKREIPENLEQLKQEQHAKFDKRYK